MTSHPHATGEVLHLGAPLAEAGLAMILIHGRGASARVILGLAEAFRVPKIAYFAPGAAANTWYPQSFLAPRKANEPFLTSALEKIAEVVRSIEAAGLARERIVLGGFSQGACLSTEFVRSHPARYAGLIAFTGGLIGPPGAIGAPADPPTSALGGMPALLLSGDPDPHVPWSRVEESAAILRSLGADVTTRRYPGRPHTVTAEEIGLAAELLRNAAVQL